MDVLRIAGIVSNSVVDGPGLRFVIFVQGCTHNCKGCHNLQTHSFSGGKEVNMRYLMKQILADKIISGVTFSGGEPFLQAESLSKLALKLRDRNVHILAYSGFTFEQLLKWGETNQHVFNLLNNVNVLIDGKFVEEQKTFSIPFAGSANQRILDVPLSLAVGKAVEAEEFLRSKRRFIV